MEYPIYNKLLEICSSDYGEVITFLHNTKSEEDAKSIVKQGFEFNSHIDYTSDVVSVKDPLTIKYFTNVREAYGKYTIVIQISRTIILNLSEALEGSSHHYSEALTVNKPKLNDDNDFVYTLAPHFIKGYLNQNTFEFIRNKTFDAHKRIELFNENLALLLNDE